MKRSTAPWVIGIAAAALIALPAASGAQTTPPQQTPPQQQTPPTTPPETTPPQQQTPQQTPPPATPPQTTPPQTTPPATQPTHPTEPQHQAHQSPADHLQQAKAALNAVEVSSVTGTAKTKLTQLKRHIAALERSAGVNDKASATGQAQRSPRATASRGNANWATEVAAIDRLLNEMLGATGTPATTDPAATTGTTGTTGTTRGTRGSRAASAVTMDDATRAKLTEVRTHITAFAASMSGTASTPSTATAPATTTTTQPTTDPASPTTPQPPTTAPQTTPPATTTQPPATGTTTGTTAAGTTTGTTTQPPTTTAADAPKPDAEAAKRHLTAARDTLSQLTQLPEAAQLTGDARNQVSQIITNFNELITTQTEWRATYAKLQANLVALIGAETTDESNVPPPATSTPGAVGTSGTATLDPKVRQKLVEFRSKLAEFERAAGGAKQ